MKMATHSEEQGSQSHGRFSNASKVPGKIVHVLEYQVLSSSLNHFEAERELGNHCLYSTISSLMYIYGLTFKYTSEKVPSHWDQSCEVTRYSLPPSEYKKARTIFTLLTKGVTRRPAAA